MENKQILFTALEKAELCPIPMPVPGAGQVLVRLCASSISGGTERANLLGNVSVNPDGGTTPFPRTPGYSSAGVVEAVGQGVTDFAVGDRVALEWSVHAHYQVRPVSQVHHLPESVSFSAAALVHIATFPLAAIRKTRLEIGESAIVMGLGVLGLVAVPLLRAAGATPIVAADPDAKRRARALELGADFAFDPTAPDFAAQVKAAVPGGMKVAIEVTGIGAGLNEVLDVTARFGRVALLGCTRKSDFTVDYYHKIHAPGITLVGAHTLARPQTESAPGWWTERDDAAALIALMGSGRFDLAQVVERRAAPEEAPEIYHQLLTEPSFPVTQFVWDEMA